MILSLPEGRCTLCNPNDPKPCPDAIARGEVTLGKVRPWQGVRFHCTGCGRATIHTGPCAFCGTRVE